MAVNLLDTRTMLLALEQMPEPRTFLLDTFFKEEEKSITEYVDIDIVKGKKRLAPFVRSIDQGKIVERAGFTQKTFQPPYIKIKMKTTAQDFLKRMAGQTIYVGSSPFERAAQQAGKDLKYLQDMIIRREEQMASQLLNTGKVVVSGDGINAEIDFGMDVTHLPTASPIWSNSSSDPLKDIRTWARVIEDDCGLVSDICVMGFDAVEAFLGHTKVQKFMDMRRVDAGEIKPNLLPNGASFVGTLRLPGLIIDIYSYNESYLDDTDTKQYFVPVGKIWMGSTRARAARHYGAIQDVEFTELVPVRWFPKSWTEKDPSVQWLLLQSAALPCLHQVDGFLSATVL